MKIFAINDHNLGIEFVYNALTDMGHSVYMENFEFNNSRVNPEFDSFFEKKIANNYDIVFTFNYVPVISANCQKYNIKYVSWVYDSPHIVLYSCTILNPCNYVFIFDRAMYLELKNGGINTVYYMPLSVDTDEMDKFIITPDIMKKYSADVSFVGSLYNEKHNLYDKFNKLPPYLQGYLDALVMCQSKIYGNFILEENLTSDIINIIQQYVPFEPNKDGVETPEYVYANYFMARKVTEIERYNIIKDVSENFSMKIYTNGDTSDFPMVHNMGPINYYDYMPYIFKCSKINLNISLKSIKSGIPLRALDIMGCKGFLISNYQADFLDYFVPGEDLVIYDSIPDLINKIDYYLNHEEERRTIAKNGYNKVKKFYTFRKHLKEIEAIIKI